MKSRAATSSPACPRWSAQSTGLAESLMEPAEEILRASKTSSSAPAGAGDRHLQNGIVIVRRRRLIYSVLHARRSRHKPAHCRSWTTPSPAPTTAPARYPAPQQACPRAWSASPASSSSRTGRDSERTAGRMARRVYFYPHYFQPRRLMSAVFIWTRSNSRSRRSSRPGHACPRVPQARDRL